jgi:replicative DNA helicase
MNSGIKMAKAEQIVTDRKTLRQLVEFMEEAVKEGLTKEEIASQNDLLLDKAAQERLKHSARDIRAGRVKHFKSAKELIESLHSD